MSLFQRTWRDFGPRTHHWDAWCTNPECSHSRRPHPVRCAVDSYGGFVDPGSATPTECPACDAELDTRPLFDADEPYISEDWE